MTETLKDMMTARADAAPGPHLEIDQVIGNGRRRVWRNRAMGGTAACAAIAAVALVVPTLSFGDSTDAGLAGSGGFETRKVTYAEGSTIHYGDQAIDVPHDVQALVQTDDGFVFSDVDDTVYFTDGDETAEIGHAGGYVRLQADDSGSYVAWVEIDEGEVPETVVYDTSAGAEVLRTDEGNGPGDGYYDDYDKPSVEALDGDTAFVLNGAGLVAVDIPTGQPTTVFGPDDGYTFNDAANGLLGLVDEELALAIRTGLDGAEQRFPNYLGAQLSPSGTRVLTQEVDRRPNGAAVVKDEQYEVLNIASGTEVTPEWGDYVHIRLSQWIDDDTLVAYGFDESGPIDLLRCSIPARGCDVVVPSLSQEDVRLPVGFNPEEW